MTQRETKTRATPQREASYELYIPPRFHWERTHGGEKAKQKAAKIHKKGFQPGHPPYVPTVPVVAVFDSGKYKRFASLCAAARTLNGNCNDRRAIINYATSVLRCCQRNKRREGATPNSDHRSRGARYYFETDIVWKTKTGESLKEKQEKQKTQIWRQWL